MEKEIRKIIDRLNYYTKLYDEGRPEISDKEWDALYFTLQRLENCYNIYFEDSPTQRVNYQVVNELKKVKHSHPMLSLDKTKDIEELKAFIGQKEYVVMAKMDGLTCSLTYENGRLIKAETRGDGLVGEDVLHNILQVKNVPNKIDYKDRIVIDGEIICTYQDFENFKEEYKNPRNFASGSIRLLDSEESSARHLSFVAWDCVEGLEKCKNLNDKFYYLRDFGFTVVPYYVNDSKEDIEYYINYEIKPRCQELGYPIDGAVLKYNDIKQYEAAGRTDHHFKGGIAFKFYDKEYETTLRDVEWTMGRTGQICPVAIFDPIEIDGSEVSKASLHNISIMKKLRIDFKTQKIFIYKANAIIPQVSRTEDRYNDLSDIKFEYLKIPDKCPYCGGATIIKKENESEILYCDNPSCSGKLVNIIDHFAGKKGMDIKGLSKATIEKLIDWGWISNCKDLYSLKNYRNEWIKKSGFGVASVDKILNAIEESKHCNFEKLISSAGILEIGTKVAKDLSKIYEGSYIAFREDIKNKYDFSNFDNIGEVMTNNLLSFDYTELDNIYKIVQDYYEYPQEEVQNNSLEGKVFCITGKTSIFKNRKELTEDIEAKGGKVTSSVTSKTNYLINNDKTSTSSKNLKAQELHIPILTEQDYLEL